MTMTGAELTVLTPCFVKLQEQKAPCPTKLLLKSYITILTHVFYRRGVDFQMLTVPQEPPQLLAASPGSSVYNRLSIFI